MSTTVFYALGGTQTPTPSNAGSSFTPMSTSSSMYLYTFLATLLILLGVSSAIVLRSIVLRRRQRLMIQAAIANGTWVPPRGRQRRSGRSKRFGEKPKMFVAALGKEDLDGDGKDDGKGAETSSKEKSRMEEKVEDFKWKDILPVSVSYITPLAIPKAPSTIPPDSDSPTPPPSNDAPPSQDLKLPPPTLKHIQTSVLIAMPFRSNPSSRPDQDSDCGGGDLPPMEFGVAELCIISTGENDHDDIIKGGGDADDDDDDDVST